MVGLFNGTPARLVIVNLKTGVLTPDIYNPRFDRARADGADQYGCFLEFAGVRRLREIGKVKLRILKPPDIQECLEARMFEAKGMICYSKCPSSCY